MPGPNAPLAVRIDDGTTDRHVTRHIRGLKFTKTAPGGHRSASFTMTLPRATFTDLGPQDRAYIYDARTTRSMWDGYIENPTPTDGPLGQQFEVSAVGGMALANDETRGLIYVDSSLDGWTREENSSSGGDVEDVSSAGNPGRRLVFRGGGVIATNAFAAVGYRDIANAGMNLGGVHVFSGSGKDDTNYRLELYVDGPPSRLYLVGDGGKITTTPTDQSFYVGGSYARSTDAVSEVFPTSTRLVFQIRRIGAATNVADDTTYSDIVVLSVIGQRMDRYGTLLTGSVGLGTAQSVLASQVVEDLLGRVLTMCDPATAEIEATSWAIDQLAYPDGVKAAQVLTDLEAWEADAYWGVGATGANGLHEFWYRAWPTTPRYEVSVKDGWRQTGSDTDLCNRILVSWTDPAGNPQTTPVTAAGLGLVGIGLPVDALGTRIKDADPITLPAGRGSEANALRIGEGILRDKINPPKAGTVVVRRPIVDHLTGSMVMPWELEPGYLCRVRETGDDLRITETSYDDDSVSTVLTLGRPVLTTEQRVARLSAA